MQYNFAVSKKAEESIYHAAQWYEQQKHGLGEAFLVAIDTAFLSIQANPLLYGFRRKNIRKYHMKKFPYLILFSVTDREVFVISAIHTYQKPKI